MSLFSGDALWPTINASHFGPVAMCVWDNASGAFRTLKSNDSLFTFNSGSAVTVASGATINIINTGIPAANVTIAGQTAGSVPINVSGVVTGTINALITNIPSFNINGQTAGSTPINVSGNITGTVTSRTLINTFNTPSNFTVSGNQQGTALVANPNRKMLYVQNLGINPIYVKFGAAGASDSSMSLALGGGVASGDGKGGSFVDDECQVTGLVSVSGVQSNYIIWDA